jgi:hypothetical protein
MYMQSGHYRGSLSGQKILFESPTPISDYWPVDIFTYLSPFPSYSQLQSPLREKIFSEARPLIPIMVVC